ncbi:MAG TPA: response regulator [Hymenobacter sp.]|uniref:response regulator n=1 Tax=Hymenobacter sp. TaxID=1898978 RepID=UPI002D8044F6|nr:response regulator [Hymenobacter sp.]HET9506095.1 response regulator [Hymenobacter sp.]
MTKPFRVLLIDDDATNNFLTERLFQRLGVADEVRVAETGQQALDLLAAPGAPVPTLVLLDLNMPGLSGAEFLTRYQAQEPEAADRPVIVVLTTSTNQQDLTLIKQLHIDGLVNKPLTEEKLEHLLQLHFPALLPAQS